MAATPNVAQEVTSPGPMHMSDLDVRYVGGKNTPFLKVNTVHNIQQPSWTAIVSIATEIRANQSTPKEEKESQEERVPPFTRTDVRIIPWRRITKPTTITFRSHLQSCPAP